MIPPMVVGPLFFPAYLPQRWQTVPLFLLSRRARDARLLRLPLPGQRQRVLAARHPRTADLLDGRVGRLRRPLLPDPVLPRLAGRRHLGADAVARASSRRRWTCSSSGTGRRCRPAWSRCRRSGRRCCCSPAGPSSAARSASWWCRVAEDGAARAYWALFRGHARGQMSYRLSFAVDAADQRERDRAGRVHDAGALHGHPHHRRLRPALGAGRQLPHRVRVRARRPAGGQHRADQGVRPHRAVRRRPGPAARRAAAAAADGHADPEDLPRAVRPRRVRRRAGPGRHPLDAGAGRAGGRRPARRDRRSSRAVFVATASVAFWWTESGEIGNAFTYGGRDFTSYPVNIYSGWFRRRVRVRPRLRVRGLLPGAGAARPRRTRWACRAGWAGSRPPSRCRPSAVAGLVWRIGVRHYRSTGS